MTPISAEEILADFQKLAVVGRLVDEPLIDIA